MMLKFSMSSYLETKRKKREKCGRKTYYPEEKKIVFICTVPSQISKLTIILENIILLHVVNICKLSKKNKYK